MSNLDNLTDEKLLKLLDSKFKLGYERGHDIGYNEGYIAGIQWCNNQMREKLLERSTDNA